MKLRYNLVPVFTLIFILGVLCFCSGKNAAPDNGTRPTIEKIECEVARQARFKDLDPLVAWDDTRMLKGTEKTPGLVQTIDDKVSALNTAYVEKEFDKIADNLDKILTHEGWTLTDKKDIEKYFKDLYKDGADQMEFVFAGAVVVPHNIHIPHLDDVDITFISHETYSFKFEFPSAPGPESADPGGSGDGESAHRKVCTWY